MSWDFRKTVLKSSRYPLTKSYDCKTSARKNLFIASFTALKRSNWKKTILDLYGIYSRLEGNYAVVPTVDINIISMFPPHFFQRYRERIVKMGLFQTKELLGTILKMTGDLLAQL
jgi:hypothetical protein